MTGFSTFTSARVPRAVFRLVYTARPGNLTPGPGSLDARSQKRGEPDVLYTNLKTALMARLAGAACPTTLSSYQPGAHIGLN